MDQDTKELYKEKRAYLLSTIKWLIGFWEDAQNTYDIVASKEVTPEFIDEIINLLDEAAQEINSEGKNSKLTEIKNKLIKAKLIEKKERNEEMKKAEEMIANI